MHETGEQWDLICTRTMGQSAKCLFCTPKGLNPTFRTHNIFFFLKKRWAWYCIWTHVLKRQRQAELWTYLPVYLPYVLISKPMRHSKKEKNAESKEKKEKEKKKDRGHPKYGNIVLLSSTCKNNCNTHVSANTWTCLFMFTDPQDCSSKLKQGCVLWP